MNKDYKYFLGVYYRLVDWLALNLAFFLAVFIRFGDEPSFSFLENNYVSLLLFINLSWILLSHWQHAYNLYRYSSKRRYFLRITIIVAVHFLFAMGVNGLIKTFYSRLFLFYTYVGFGALMLFGRWASNVLYKLYVKKQRNESYVVLVGEGFSMRDIEHFLRENSIGDAFQKVHTIPSTQGIIGELEVLKEDAPVAEVYINLSQADQHLVEELAAYCDNNFIRWRLVLDWQGIGSRRISSRKLSETTVFNVPLTPLDDAYNSLIKRLFDVFFSAFVLVGVLSWLFPIIAVVIKLTSKGPVLFKQKRTGMDNKQFVCWKFRSMVTNSEADTHQAAENDPRITRFGAFMRRTSLDELPQFINVLRGEMSVVGPRPHMLQHTEAYSKQIGNFMNRHAIKPGITGLAQIKGYRGEIDTPFLLQNRVRLDRFYVNNWSLYLDVKIIFLTIFSVFREHK